MLIFLDLDKEIVDQETEDVIVVQEIETEIVDQEIETEIEIVDLEIETEIEIVNLDRDQPVDIEVKRKNILVQEVQMIIERVKDIPQDHTPVNTQVTHNILFSFSSTAFPRGAWDFSCLLVCHLEILPHPSPP